MPERPLVSILLRARDEEPALRRLLPVLKRQQTDFAFEIWVIDNESRDGTAALAREEGVCYSFISRDAFNYAAALNMGAAQARGEIVVSLSAHCFPEDERWLAALVAPLRRDPAVIATYGRQITDPAASPFEALADAEFFPAAGAQPATVAFSNANSALRRDYVLLHPFNPAIKILEDHLFYLELSGEHQIVYVPEAAVVHRHERFSWRYYIRRWVREGWSFYFLKHHRGLHSPFVPPAIVRLYQLFVVYPRLALGFARQGNRWAALRAIPFFWLRDVVWLASFIRAWLRHPTMARLDTALLLRTNLHLLRLALEGGRGAGPGADAPLHWSEEWQLKADWGFIRKNIADFIRACHERGLIGSPLLEVGASGQNDYLAEWYEMHTSNLASNLQGAELPLDMEDMRTIVSGSIGTVLCSEVIEHVRHPERAVAEAFRVLRPGGTLILTTPYSIVIHNTKEDGGFHGRNFTPQGLELIVREAGFEVVLSETRGQTETRRRLMPSNIFVVGRKPALH
ncbi:MAG TPA: glycosyltransferase [Roseiflexaceae bacterium]|nr:glycosyltransferase [Roseiflexaceae bacterium]